MASLEVRESYEVVEARDNLMGCCGGRKRHNTLPKPQAEVGAQGLVWVESVSGVTEPVYGTITGSRYEFHQQSLLLVDARDVEHLGTEFVVYDSDQSNPS